MQIPKETFLKFCFGAKFVLKGNYRDCSEKCSCNIGYPNEICRYFFSVWYHLNFRCYKFCIDVINFVLEVPNCFVEKVVPLDTYLKKIICDPFFFSSNRKVVKVSLDNPDKGKIPAKTD